MSDRANRKPKIIKIPGPDHPITIERDAHRIVVVVAGRVVADTRAASILRERATRRSSIIPLKDVDTALLQRTVHATYCPYKGDCAYYSIPLGESVRSTLFGPISALRRGRRDQGPRRFLSRPC